MLLIYLILLLQRFVGSLRLTESKQAHRHFQPSLMLPFKQSSSSPSFPPVSFIDVSPSWEEIDTLLRSKETPQERAEFDSQLRGRGFANHAVSTNIRLFDAPDGYDPEITLYRDTAAWCPYCEKIWLQLEEKRIPYRVEKAPLRCYGEKPKSFLKVSPR